MDLLTIGAFARAARLTPKALRLYDDLGLLPPAAVDPESGYRLYDPEQLAHARLIGRLREIGMPLADIRTVCDLDPAAAADAVTAYWRQVTAGNATRARQVALLVEHLGKRSATMSLRYAARVDAGHARDTNEDAAYAGDRLLAVADGMRGPAGGAASAATIEALRTLEPSDEPAAALLTALTVKLNEIDGDLRATSGVTTLTALVRRGTQLALIHIGDSRAYLLRGGELTQLTQDHTWVRDQVDHGKLTPAEAAAHPQRALLTRALGAGPQPVEADLALRTALPGDRYLLCSDGLSASAPRDALLAALSSGAAPDETADRLVALAHEAGAPDNIAVVVADVAQA
ncbi:MerR family transcriptional regulator [Actinoplanes sp. CA-030573]|uniref:MerR family transcriptional regulator n=1 Tax=Actinoplanes sp. CA-030573 TaxID=3239898 RepID=UPI003D8F5BBD